MNVLVKALICVAVDASGTTAALGFAGAAKLLPVTAKYVVPGIVKPRSQ